MKTYKFIRSAKDWFIELPDYLIQGGSIGDLQMVDGADKMLDMMAGNNDSVIVTVSQKEFEGSDELVLTEKCDPLIGGGHYLLKTYENQEINRTMWLCQVIEFVFTEVPNRIYIRRESYNSLQQLT